MKDARLMKEIIVINNVDTTWEQDSDPVELFPGGGTWVNVCWVCAAGLSEPLPHFSLFFGQL